MKYWDPITGKEYKASIDWCELNYQVSDYIVEFWNAFSSLSFVLIGLINIYVLRKSDRMAIEKFIALLYILVGLGSAAFHGTLKYTYQLWDEIPMVWVISSALFAYFTIKPSSTSYKLKLFVFFILYDGFWMIIHSYSAFVIVFQVNFVLMYATMVFTMFKLQKEIGSLQSKAILRLHMICLVTGFSSWLTDKALCDLMNQTVNPQLHSWWHVLMSLSAHYALIFESLLKSKYLQKELEVKSMFFLQENSHKHKN